MTNDPTSWRSGMESLKVGDAFTEEWLDRFRALMTAYSGVRRDAERYRICRESGIALARSPNHMQIKVSGEALDSLLDRIIKSGT